VRERHPLRSPEEAKLAGACRLVPLAEDVARIVVQEPFCRNVIGSTNRSAELRPRKDPPFVAHRAVWSPPQGGSQHPDSNRRVVACDLSPMYLA
jgi:hypothetical protein